MYYNLILIYQCSRYMLYVQVSCGHKKAAGLKVFRFLGQPLGFYMSEMHFTARPDPGLLDRCYRPADPVGHPGKVPEDRPAVRRPLWPCPRMLHAMHC